MPGSILMRAVSVNPALVKKRRFRPQVPGVVSGDPRVTGGLANPTGEVYPANYGNVIYKYQTQAGLVISDGGHAQVGDAKLELLFWGGFWQNATNPPVNDILTAVQSIVDSPYTSELQQYGFNSITSVGSTIVLTPGPPANTYAESDLQDMVWALIDNNMFPEPDDDGGKIIYMVFSPPGTVYGPNPPGAHGDETDNDFPYLDTDHAWVGWIAYTSQQYVGPNATILDGMMTVFSHELAETISDPQPPTGWTFPALSTSTSNSEIGDVCGGLFGPEGPYLVSSYYSKRLGACVVPAKLMMRLVNLSEVDSMIGPADHQPSQTFTAAVNSTCFSGNYSATQVFQQEQIVFTADISSYISPTFSWVINGQPMADGSTTIRFPVDQGIDPLTKIVPLPPETADVHFVASGATLTITSTSGAGAADLDISATCVEAKMPSGYDTQRSAAMFTIISGRTRTMDQRFNSDLLKCLLNRTKGMYKIIEAMLPFIDKGDPVPPWAQREVSEIVSQVVLASQRATQLTGVLSDPALAPGRASQRTAAAPKAIR